ncbi:MAG: hypothetical protein IJT49_07320 [Clostridia bacterium]|nr:hypothetical protein [Clostridia bacterium]
MKKLLSAILTAITVVTAVCQIHTVSASADTGTPVSAEAGITGDINKDSKVNNKDVTVLFRHLSGSAQTDFDTVAADCNGDGNVDNKDVVDLFRFLSGANIKLYYGKKPATPKDPGYIIPDEDLSGKNVSSDPLSDDGDGAAILTRLKKDKTVRNNLAQPENNVTRVKFAEDIVYMSGFGKNLNDYICNNDYSDLGSYTNKMKFSEIAVNQGYMLIPEAAEFQPDDDITYGEVLRGLLYALGYREYADERGVAKLSSEIGLSNYVDLSKKNSETLSYAEYAQVVSNALRLKLVQCIEKNGEYSVVSRGSNYDLKTTYLQNNPYEKDSIFRVANSGWDIYDPGAGKTGYRYGPSFIINDDGTIDCWLASNPGVSGEIDWGMYRKSYDNGFTWTTDTGAVRPTSAAEDWNWSCDPGVIKIGKYYYATYTTILWHDGVDNNLFVARSETPEGAFVEKWDGTGWGNDPRPIISYDGTKSDWGCGEGSMVVVGDTLYIYASWITASNTVEYTKVYTADATSENWPETMVYRGVAYKHANAEDSADVKYIDAYNCFISVATANRFNESCYINVMTSFDGIYFRHEASLYHTTASSNIQTCIHNMGITGDRLGHIDIFNTQQYVGYAYQPDGYSWACWRTRLSPIVFIGSDNYKHLSRVISKDASDTNVSDTTHTPDVVQIRMGSNNYYVSTGSRTISITSKGTSKACNMTLTNKNGSSSIASNNVLKQTEFIYDRTKLQLDISGSTFKVKLLADEVVRVYAKYNGLMCEMAVVPAYLDQTGPVAFYPETDTVTIYAKSETKQPAFIAKSAVNEYLMLWGNTSSYTEATNKDNSASVQGWDQGCTLSGYDESVISVSADGKITAKKVGTTTITATYMGLTATIKVEVKKL